MDDKVYSRPLKDSLAEVEKHILTNALKVYNDKVHIVSQKLKVGKTALYGKMKKYGILCKGDK